MLPMIYLLSPLILILPLVVVFLLLLVVYVVAFDVAIVVAFIAPKYTTFSVVADAIGDAASRYHCF